MKFLIYFFAILFGTGFAMAATTSNQPRADIGSIAEDALALAEDILKAIADGIKLAGDISSVINARKRESGELEERAANPLASLTTYLNDIGQTARSVTTMATHINELQPGAINGAQMLSLVKGLESQVTPLVSLVTAGLPAFEAAVVSTLVGDFQDIIAEAVGALERI